MKYLAAIVALLAVTFIGAATPQVAKAEICATATVFDIQVYRSNGSVVTQQNKADRNEILTFTWNICPDAQVTDNFGNNRWGDYQFQRGISDQPQGGFNWIVSSQGDSRQMFVYINDPVAPPPPPPPPPSNEGTCCSGHSAPVVATMTVAEARQYLPLPLNFGSGGNPKHKCWHTGGEKGPQYAGKPAEKHQGIGLYYRQAIQRGYWCAVSGESVLTDKIVSSGIANDWNSGFACSKVSDNKSKTGITTHSVTWKTRVYFSCEFPWLFFDYNCDQWTEVRYTDYGLAVEVNVGGK